MEQIWFSGLNMETTTCVGHVLVYAHSLSSQFLSFTIWFKLFATLCLQRQPSAGVLMNCTNYFDVCLVASVTVAPFAGETLTKHGGTSNGHGKKVARTTKRSPSIRQLTCFVLGHRRDTGGTWRDTRGT